MPILNNFTVRRFLNYNTPEDHEYTQIIDSIYTIKKGIGVVARKILLEKHSFT